MVRHYSFLWLNNIPVCVCVCVCVTQLLYLSMDMGCFRALAIVHNAAVNTGVHIPFLFFNIQSSLYFFHYHLVPYTHLPPAITTCCPCPRVLFPFCSTPPSNPLPPDTTSCHPALHLSLSPFSLLVQFEVNVFVSFGFILRSRIAGHMLIIFLIF